MTLAALSGFASGFAGGLGARRDRDERQAEIARQDKLIATYGAMGALPNAPAQTAGLGAQPAMAPPSRTGLFGLIDATEGGGRYDTLYGNAQNGGRFAGVDVSRMTLNDLYAFSDPSGAYGQWVAGNNHGVIATPMGRHQIVGTTLRSAATEMGLSPDTVFTPQTQDAVAAHLARRRIAGADTPASKRAAMRAEWAGFKSVPDQALDAAIADFEANGGQLRPRPLGASPM